MFKWQLYVSMEDSLRQQREWGRMAAGESDSFKVRWTAWVRAWACVRVGVGACVRVGVHACARACVGSVCVRVRVRVFACTGAHAFNIAATLPSYEHL